MKYPDPQHPHHTKHYSSPDDCLPCDTYTQCDPCHPYFHVCTPLHTIALDANVQDVVNAINMCMVIPYGDYGGTTVYYFTTMCNGLGNLVYTIFDRTTTLGLSSFMVRYGAAATIRQILFEPFPRNQIDLQFMILPHVPLHTHHNGTVIP